MEEKNKKQENAAQQFRQIDPAALIEVLKSENLHTQALVIENLAPSKAAYIFQNMNEDIQDDLLEEIIHGERISQEVLDSTLHDILEKVNELQNKHYISLGSADFVAEIMSNIDRRTEKRLICNLEEKDAEMAEEIKKRMFVFEDIIMLDDRAVQKILRELDAQEIALSLKGTDNDVQEKIFRNMSKDAAASLKEDIEFIGSVLIKNVEETQQKIVSIIKRLEESGEIYISHSTEDDFILYCANFIGYLASGTAKRSGAVQ